MNRELKTEQDSPPNRENHAAVIAFGLALLGFVSCGLTAVPALILSLIGIRRRKHRMFAVTSLVLSLGFLFLQILFITPMGVVPRPLNLLKYWMVCESRFWLNFDRKHIVGARSERTLLLLGSLGSIHFKAAQANTYDPNQVISFARRNGWTYGGKVHLTTEDFSMFLTTPDKLLEEDLDLWQTMWEVVGCDIRRPLWITDDCTVLAFDTGMGNGLPSYVMVNDQGSEVTVYANQGVYPDGPHSFRLPPLFEED